MNILAQEANKSDYLIFSKKQTVKIIDEKVNINGVDTPPPEGSNAVDYAKKYARIKYEAYLRDCLLADNLIILTGAGSSILPEGKSGLSMKGLWEASEEKLNYTASSSFERFCGVVHYNQEASENLEALLTDAQLYLSFNEKVGKKNEDFNFVTEAYNSLKKLIVEKCNFADNQVAEKSFDGACHLNFLKNITYRKTRLSRPKIFTTNYDRAFEVAAASGGFITIDGFSFDSQRSFNGKFFDYDIVLTKNNRVTTEDNFAPNVIHLYKLHGSIDWFQKEKMVYKQNKGENEELPLLIFPNKEKFQLSFDQPYFEMMSRFQSELRKSGSTTLIIIGFSFGDNHINRVIEEALNHNSFLKIIVVDISLKNLLQSEQQPQIFLRNKAQETEQVILIKEAFNDFVNFMPSPKEREVEIFGENDDKKPK